MPIRLLSAAEADPTPGKNNSATVTPVPVPQANVGITKPSTTLPQCRQVIFTLTASNAGPVQLQPYRLVMYCQQAIPHKQHDTKCGYV
jgi:hypothetical protein